MASLTEAFAYSNGSLPTVSGGVWSTLGLGDITVTSGRAVTPGTGTLYANARAIGFTPSGDWEISAVLNAGTNGAAGTGPAFWAVDASYNGYGFFINGTRIGISEITGGTPADLTSATSTTGSGDNTWRLTRTSAGAFTLYRNGTSVLTTSDTSHSSPNQILLLLQSDSATILPSWDDLWVQDFITISHPTRRRRLALTFR